MKTVLSNQIQRKALIKTLQAFYDPGLYIAYTCCHVCLSKNADTALPCDSPLTYPYTGRCFYPLPTPLFRPSSSLSEARAVAGTGTQRPTVVHQADVQN